MTSEIHLAFSHPVERSKATHSGESLDRISVRDYVLEMEIGAFQAERGIKQRISFNVVVEVRPVEQSVDDDVDRILSYDKVTDAIGAALASERLNLLETLAENIARRVLSEPQAERVFVRIEKLDRGPGALGVEIVRTRETVSAELSGAEKYGSTPSVVLLSREAIQSPLLGGWIDQSETSGTPFIFCVQPDQSSVSKVSNPLVQRRIDLLAFEQAAWELADKDARCSVVGTRAELEWAVGRNQVCVWAPSKMVLDSGDAPSTLPLDSGALAVWLAETLEARELVVIGSFAPECDTFPVRLIAPDQAQL